MANTANDTQLLKSTLDICLLAMIEEDDSYGYEMVKALKDRGFPVDSERSVYPVLRRLNKDGLTESYLQSSTDGPARTYYRITEQGKGALRERASYTFEAFETTREIVAERVELGDRNSS